MFYAFLDPSFLSLFGHDIIHQFMDVRLFPDVIFMKKIICQHSIHVSVYIHNFLFF